MSESEHKCPHCKTPVRYPEHPKCMCCGNPLTEDLLLSKDQAKAKIQSKEKQRIQSTEDEQKQSEGIWGYKKFRESGRYEDDDGWG